MLRLYLYTQPIRNNGIEKGHCISQMLSIECVESQQKQLQQQKNTFHYYLPHLSNDHFSCQRRKKACRAFKKVSNLKKFNVEL